MNSTSLGPSARDSYWHQTQAELQSVKRRGDILILTVTGLLVLILAVVQDKMHDLETWLFICAALLATFVGVMWFVASRKRQIAADRGLICSICRYKPHDTEIEEIVETRRCPSCASEL